MFGGPGPPWQTLPWRRSPRRKESSMAIELEFISPGCPWAARSEEHTSELQSRLHLVCRLLLEEKRRRMRHRCSSSCSIALAVDPLTKARQQGWSPAWLSVLGPPSLACHPPDPCPYSRDAWLPY